MPPPRIRMPTSINNGKSKPDLVDSADVPPLVEKLENRPSQPPTAPSHQTNYAPPKRIDCLDSIRGLAALSVLLGHISGAFEWPANFAHLRNVPVLNMLFDGRSAVTMFFVLSGFVLAHPYLAPQNPEHPPRSLFIPTFYLRRVTRIWIPWFAAFIISLGAQHFFFSAPSTTPGPTTWSQEFWHENMTPANFLRQCLFSLNDARQQLLPQDWSLRVELKGSFLIPVFLFLVRRSPIGLALVGAIFLTIFPTGHYYISFILGVVASKLFWKYSSRLRFLSFRMKCFFLVGGILMYESRLFAGYFWDVVGVVDKIVWSIASLGCVLVLAASLSSRRIETNLNAPVAALLGRISYSVYLLQFIVILVILPWFVHLLNEIGLTSAVWLYPLTLVLGVGITAVVSIGMYKTVEVPSIHFGRWATKQIQSRLSRAPQ